MEQTKGKRSIDVVLLAGNGANRLKEEAQSRSHEVGERQKPALQALTTAILAPVEDQSVLKRLVYNLSGLSRLHHSLASVHVVTNDTSLDAVVAEGQDAGLDAAKIMSNGLSADSQQQSNVDDLCLAVQHFHLSEHDVLAISAEHFFIPEYRTSSLIERMLLAPARSLACYRPEEAEVNQLQLVQTPSSTGSVLRVQQLQPLQHQLIRNRDTLIAAPIAMLGPEDIYHLQQNCEERDLPLALTAECWKETCVALELGFGHLDVRSLDGFNFAHALLMHAYTARKNPEFRSKSVHHTSFSLNHLFGSNAGHGPSAIRLSVHGDTTTRYNQSSQPDPLHCTSLTTDGYKALAHFSDSFHRRREALQGRGATQTQVPSTFYATSYARQAAHSSPSNTEPLASSLSNAF